MNNTLAFVYIPVNKKIVPNSHLYESPHSFQLKSYHTILKRDTNKLSILKPVLDKSSNILGMTEIQCSINLIQDVKRSGLIHAEREDKS